MLFGLSLIRVANASDRNAYIQIVKSLLEFLYWNATREMTMMNGNGRACTFGTSWREVKRISRGLEMEARRGMERCWIVYKYLALKKASLPPKEDLIKLNNKRKK